MTSLFLLRGDLANWCSTVFRDMLSLPTPVNVNSIRNPPSPSTSSTENAIDIPADSGTLRIFIQLLEQGAVERISLFRSPFPVPGRRPRRTDSPGAPNPEAKPIEELTTLMDLLLRFDCSQAIQERAMHINHHVLYQDPWAGFVIAAKGNHMNHAREAIGHFHEVKGPATVDPGRMSLGAIKSIPIEWFAGYLRAVGAQKAALESVSAHQLSATASLTSSLDRVLEVWRK